MELQHLLQDKISLAKLLISKTHEYLKIEGICKLRRKIQQELKFLQKILENQTFKKEHLQCSNLSHYSAVLNTLKETDDCISVCKTYVLNERKICVDIVSNDGLNWTKVVARNPIALSQVSMGNGGYGVRSVIDQAEEFLECAKLHPCMFQTPTVIFTFALGVGKNLALKLECMGVIVKGDKINDDHLFHDEENSENVIRNPTDSIKKYEQISKVNLDVSAMLAYCSSVTNGSALKYKFAVPVLTQQAKWEQMRPQKPILDRFFEGKTLYCCETAKNNFINIINTVGGSNERQRGIEFLSRIKVLPDNTKMEDFEEDKEIRALFNNVQFTLDKSLNIGGKIRERSLTIFKFGDNIRAVTVTANEGFVRAAKQQGINFVVFIHESRALTEQKEILKGTYEEFDS